MINKVKGVLDKFVFNQYIGTLIRFIKGDRLMTHGVKIDIRHITPYIISLLYFNRYEKAEISFIKKYLNYDKDILELGSSIGVVSSFIGKRLKKHRLFCIEIDADLIPTIEENLQLNQVRNYTILNVGIGKNNTKMNFHKGKHNTHGTISDEGDGLNVDLVSLSTLIEENNITSYDLICDIEGAEIDILLHDKDALKKCSMFILEAHNVKREGTLYEYTDVRDLVIELGFELVEANSNNFVFKNKHI